MGIDDTFGFAFAKAHMAANQDLPLSGGVFVSVVDRDKKYIPTICKELQEMGHVVLATPGTAKFLEAAGLEDVKEIAKIGRGTPDVLDYMESGEIKLVINTPSGRGRERDEAKIRERTITLNIPCITTIPAARAAVNGIRELKRSDYDVRPLQDYFPR